jgi:hypothetical protein
LTANNIIHLLNQFPTHPSLLHAHAASTNSSEATILLCCYIHEVSRHAQTCVIGRTRPLHPRFPSFSPLTISFPNAVAFTCALSKPTDGYNSFTSLSPQSIKACKHVHNRVRVPSLPSTPSSNAPTICTPNLVAFIRTFSKLTNSSKFVHHLNVQDFKTCISMHNGKRSPSLTLIPFLSASHPTTHAFGLPVLYFSVGSTSLVHHPPLASVSVFPFPGPFNSPILPSISIFDSLSPEVTSIVVVKKLYLCHSTAV